MKKKDGYLTDDEGNVVKVYIDGCPFGEELRKDFGGFRDDVNKMLLMHGRDIADVNRKLFGNGDEYLSLVGRVKDNTKIATKVEKLAEKVDEIESTIVTKTDMEKQGAKIARNVTIAIGAIGLVFALITFVSNMRESQITIEQMKSIIIEEIKKARP